MDDVTSVFIQTVNVQNVVFTMHWSKVEVNQFEFSQGMFLNRLIYYSYVFDISVWLFAVIFAHCFQHYEDCACRVYSDVISYIILVASCEFMEIDVYVL